MNALKFFHALTKITRYFLRICPTTSPIENPDCVTTALELGRNSLVTLNAIVR